MLTLRVALQVAGRGDRAELLRLAAYSEEQFVYYTNQVPVIFAYARADNQENRRRGIVGQNSGFRQGVRNLNYVPVANHPATTSEQPTGFTIRYFDLGRQAWRSYRTGNLITISAFWSESEGQFVDTPELAGIVRGKPFESSPGSGAAQRNEERAARSAARQSRQRQRETERQNQRTNERQNRLDRKRQNAITRSAR